MNAAVLLVVKRDAVAGALVAQAAHRIHVQRPESGTALAARDNPVGPRVADVDMAKQWLRRDAMPRAPRLMPVPAFMKRGDRR